MHPESIISRFWSYVDTSGGPDSCWEWQRGKTSRGYGAWKPYGTPGPSIPTHRMSWEITYGAIPEGMLVCHKCDNRPCCNPSHLFLGDHLANAKDRVQKGRSNVRDMRGANHPRARLTEEKVCEIRVASAGGETLASIANRFAIAEQTAGHIVSRYRWKHVSCCLKEG